MTDASATPVPVVLHFRAGKTERVRITPRIDSARNTLPVIGDADDVREVPFTDLKAVFFLQDPAVVTPSDPPVGSTLAVEFEDGELIRGFANAYNPSASGFFLVPHDRSKNDRIFVVNSAVVSIDVEKL